MDSLFKHIDLTTNQVAIKRARETITEWANGIPNHGIKDFGNQITINGIHLVPTHSLVLQTQYEERGVVKTEEPYTNQKIPELRYTDIKQVDPWKFNLNTVKAFQDKSITYNVTGSHQVHTCSTCSGKGHITCPTCKGKGIHNCPTCRATGRMECRNCGGSGNHQCTACGGSGRKKPQSCSRCGGSGNVYSQSEQRWQQCPSCAGRGTTGSTTCHVCGGTGQQRCRTCGGSGKTTCSNCGGNGQVTCMTCKGAKIVTCHQCKGNKKVVSYFVIKHQFRKTEDYQQQNHPSVTQNFRQFKMIPSDYCTEIVFEKTAENLPHNLFEQYPFLEKAYKRMILKAAGGKNSGAKIIQQDVKVTSTDVVAVDYEYNGKKFDLLIYGQSDKVHAQWSPISDIRDNLFEKAKALYEKNEFSKCYDALQTADTMNQGAKVGYIEKLKKRTLTKINSSYKVGSLWGTILSTYLFLSATLFFLKKPRFIIPNINHAYAEVDWLQSILPITVCVIFLLLIRNVHKASNQFCARYCVAKISSSSFRIMAGVFVSSFFVFLLWLTVMLGNATGASIIFSFPGYYAVQLYHLLTSLF